MEKLTLQEFTSHIMTGKQPLVGGGSTAALCGSMAASLVGLVSTISFDGMGEEDSAYLTKYVKDCETARVSLLKDISNDAISFEKVIVAFKMPKDTDEEKVARSKEIQEGYKSAVATPLRVAQTSINIFDALEFLMRKGNRSAETDILTATMCARNAVLAAVCNIRINLKKVKDEQYVLDMTAISEELWEKATAREQTIIELSNLI